MRLLSARLLNFRNIKETELHFSPHFTLLLGKNGQGKTNTLEALYLASALKPLRPVPLRALLREGQVESRLKLEVFRDTTGLTHTLEWSLCQKSRRLQKDDKACRSADFLGTSVAVAFTPDDLSLAKGGPEGRRRFLDRAILNLKPAYLSCALRYAKAVRDRNRLLVDRGSDELLQAFDVVITTEGAAIALARAEYIENLAPRVVSYFKDIAAPAPPFEMKYQASLSDAIDRSSKANTQQAFYEQLSARRNEDRRRKTTSLGPHLDDICFFMDGALAKDRASQGQHRALALALKLAELEYLAEELHEPPILLLDDMSSELDESRSRQLFESVRSLKGQVILTSTHDQKAIRSLLHSEQEMIVYEVCQGGLIRA